jgi:ABC-type glycerol-3-phosphate transport system substrate-binding protein
MKRLLIVTIAVLGVWACGQNAGEKAAATDTLTRRQKDSIVSTLPLPGASGIGRAQRAVDKANARVLQHDTIR